MNVNAIKRLGDLCSFGSDDADFWLITSGEKIGCPVEAKTTGTIGVKVTRTDVLVPRYLFYVFQHMATQGAFRNVTKLDSGVLGSIPIQSP